MSGEDYPNTNPSKFYPEDFKESKPDGIGL
jgi:hypothetical protein